MTSLEIKTILEEHCKWLEDNKSGKCADLSNADLSKTDLRCVNLRCADLSDADLSDADLSNTDLSNADLSDANLRGSDLSKTDLRWANLSDADLSDADLSNTDLRGVNLYYPIACPESGTFTAWKKAKNYIIKLEVLEDAKRSSATSRECRCDKAKVVAIENIDGSESHITEVNSNYDKEFIYRVGEVVSVEDFDDNRWNECVPGIHFFITREEAVRYP